MTEYDRFHSYMFFVNFTLFIFTLNNNFQNTQSIFKHRKEFKTHKVVLNTEKSSKHRKYFQTQKSVQNTESIFKHRTNSKHRELF